MMNLLSKLFGTKIEKDLKVLNPILNTAIKAYPEIAKLTNDELRAKTLQFKEAIRERVKAEEDEIIALKERIDLEYDMDVEEKEALYLDIERLEKESYDKTKVILNEILPEAFQVIKETALRFKDNEVVEVTATDFDRTLATKRGNIEIVGDKALYHNKWMAGGNLITWDMCHYDVQLIGGIVLHQGKISEMATGEGKTLVATLPVYLNALPGKGVHVVTVNDYLAKRDSEWMGMLYEFHGLRVECIDRYQPNSLERRQAYLADITYGTNNEFGFDYLRDNMTHDPDEMVQREHNYAIVDEVDSVLIDDARTPLIISGPTPRGDHQEFDDLKPQILKLYNLQRTLVTSILAESKRLLQGDPDSEKRKEGGKLLLRAYRGLPKSKPIIKFLSEPGMKALLQSTENFYMQEQNRNMHIVDEPLYFVIDEKNNQIELTDKGIDLLNQSYNDNNFFLLPDVGSEIADIERLGLSPAEKVERKSALLSDYAIKSERVHTVNQLLRAYTLFEIDIQYVVMDNKVKIVDEGTGRILEGRRYSDGLHQAIEAKENVQIEAATQTYATITLQNYFRMYKKLAGMTGTAITEAGEFWDIYKLDVVEIPTNRDVIRADREDLIYKTKRAKYNAVIDEVDKLVKAGRPILVGTTSVETSELLSRMLNLRQIKHNVLNAKFHQREAEIILEAGKAGTVTIATNMAGRGTDIKLGPGVKEAGGLAIIGTERHESRRVDRQLRGRAGRQGDPGSSQFFVSLEDDLMRMFGSARIAKVMDSLGLKEGEVIQHSMITKSIERAQKKVEENNFGIRKRLLEYDDVMNQQREVIYKKRRHALFGERLAIDISNMMYDVCEQIVNDYHESADYHSFINEMLKNLAYDPNITEDEFTKGDKEEMINRIYNELYANYKAKTKLIAERANPVIRDVYENHPHYENIAIPFTDGRHTIQVVANLKKAYTDKGREVILSFEKGITLNSIDDAWKEHLRELDDLKQSVQNASYEQKDPLLIYKFESFSLFKGLIQKVNRDISSFLIKGNLPLIEGEEVKEARIPKKSNHSKIREGRQDPLSQIAPTSQPEITAPIHVEKRVGRNDPCPCGSGKKFKNCHGREE